MIITNQEKRFGRNPIEKQKTIVESILNNMVISSENIDENCRKHNINKSTFYIYLKKLFPKEHYENILRGDRRPSKYFFNIDKFKNDSAEKFYWLGFICADGSVNEKRLRIELKYSDYNHLEKFVRFLESNYKISEANINSNSRNHSCYVSVNSKELIEYLSKYSIVRNKANIVNMNNIPNCYKVDFVRGFIDGDGSIGVKRFNKGYNMSIPQIHFNIATGSITMAEQISEVLELNNKLTDYKTYYKISCLGK